ncbi:MAG TPA: DoxX family protein [Phnomibacter sp.]|nr:DoxX family protein [Phnomibacter sp.]
MKFPGIIIFALRAVAAIILLQTLYFKFTAHPESVAIFTKLGVEPWGRLFTGAIELLAGIMLLVRRTAFYGAVVAAMLMAGAIASHLFIIGIASAGDGGQLFMLAWLVLIISLIVAYLYRHDLARYGFLPPILRKKFFMEPKA